MSKDKFEYEVVEEFGHITERGFEMAKVGERVFRDQPTESRHLKLVAAPAAFTKAEAEKAKKARAAAEAAVEAAKKALADADTDAKRVEAQAALEAAETALAALG